MKNFFFAVLFITIGGILYLLLNRNDKEIKTLQANIVYLQKQNKALQEGQTVIKKQLDTLKRNTDTLKRGQELIFNEVKKVQDKTFWDLF